MSDTVTDIRKTIAKQQVTLEEIAKEARRIQKNECASTLEKTLTSSVISLSEGFSETLERLSEQLK